MYSASLGLMCAALHRKYVVKQDGRWIHPVSGRWAHSKHVKCVYFDNYLTITSGPNVTPDFIARASVMIYS